LGPHLYILLDTHYDIVEKYFYLINNTSLLFLKNGGLPKNLYFNLILRFDLNVLLLLLL